MPGLDFAIDPVTGDFTDAADGSFGSTRTADSAVMMQLLHHFDRWWGDPDAGSRLYLAHEQGDGPGGEEFLDTEIRRALQPLIDSGRIANLTLVITRTQAGRLVAETSWRDVASGQIVDRLVEPFGG